MKKLILILTVLVAVSAVQAAPTFKFSQADLLNFVKIDSLSNNQPIFDGPTTGNNGYYSDDGIFSLRGAVGFTGYIQKSGESIALGLEDVDLTALEGYNENGDGTFQMTINNDNDDIWEYRLFVRQSANSAALYVPDNDKLSLEGLNSGNVPNSGILSLDISNLTLDDISAIGLEITATQSDAYHTSVTVPAPGAFLLGGIGLSIVGYIKKRRMLN